MCCLFFSCERALWSLRQRYINIVRSIGYFFVMWASKVCPKATPKWIGLSSSFESTSPSHVSLTLGIIIDINMLQRRWKFYDMCNWVLQASLDKEHENVEDCNFSYLNIVTSFTFDIQDIISLKELHKKHTSNWNQSLPSKWYSCLQ